MMPTARAEGGEPMGGGRKALRKAFHGALLAWNLRRDQHGSRRAVTFDLTPGKNSKRY